MVNAFLGGAFVVLVMVEMIAVRDLALCYVEAMGITSMVNVNVSQDGKVKSVACVTTNARCPTATAMVIVKRDVVFVSKDLPETSVKKLIVLTQLVQATGSVWMGPVFVKRDGKDRIVHNWTRMRDNVFRIVRLTGNSTSKPSNVSATRAG